MALADAPVAPEVGGDALVSLVGASDQTFDVIRPLLETYSSRAVHFGPTGAGHTAKLVHNFVNHGQALLLAEAFAACARGRVDVGSLFEVMSASVANSGTLQQLVPPMLNGELDFFFPVESSQEPMFDLLGTPPEHKKRLTYPRGHTVPRNELVKESLAWLDRYLGPA